MTNVEISGKVIKGDGYGRTLGFPTANLDRRDYCRRHLRIKLGVYAGYAVIGTAIGRTSHRYRAAIVIGPLDKKSLPKLEVHLLGFKGNLYEKKMVISLEKYLRPFRKFKDEEGLKRQIKNDINQIRMM